MSSAAEIHASADAVKALEEMLEDYADDNELVKMLCEAFVGELPDQVAGLKSTAAEGDATKTERAAHAFKGSAAAAGAVALQAVLRQVESAARAGDTAAVAEHVARVEAEAERAAEILNGYMARL